MEKKTVLNLCGRRGFTFPKVETEQLGSITSAIIDKRKSSVRKLKKLCRGQDIIISKKCDWHNIFNNRKNKWDNFSYELAIPVINKICRQVSEKFAGIIPYEEIYVCAQQDFALSIIEEIWSFANLFVVISDEETDVELYNKLYFEHSVMAMHRKRITQIKNDSMIICFRENDIPEGCAVPVVNFTGKRMGLKNEVDGRKISVSDARIRQAEMLWNGRGGFSFFELLGEKTSHNSNVDINNRADEIFLLDISGF